MSQSWPGPEPAETPDDSSLRQSALIAYALMIAGFMTGITAIIAVVLAYVRLPDAAGTVWQGHFRNIVVVFWVVLGAFAASLAVMPFFVWSFYEHRLDDPFFPPAAIPAFLWLLALPALAVWFLYRMIRGLVHAADGRPY